MNFDPRRENTMDRQELAEGLSELGGLIWRAVHADDEITEVVFELADKKLSLDKVDPDDTRLDPNAADWIMGLDGDTESLENQRLLVPPREWSKYALFNFALDWVIDQALMRMKIEQKWRFQQNDGLSKP